MGWFFPETPKKPSGNSKPRKEDKFGKYGVPREQLKKELSRSGSTMPYHAQHFSQQERMRMEKEVFGAKYGTHVSKYEYQKAIEKLQIDARKKTGQERLKIEKKIGLLKTMRKRLGSL